MSAREVAYELPDPEGDWLVGFVTENEAGYIPTTYTGDRDYCRAVANSINSTRNVTRSEVLEIVASSMRQTATD